MASGKSLELRYLQRPAPQTITSHTGTNRFNRRHIAQMPLGGGEISPKVNIPKDSQPHGTNEPYVNITRNNANGVQRFIQRRRVRRG